MKINGYTVYYKQYGHSYAKPYVYIEKKTLCRRSKLKEVWEGSEHKFYDDAEKMMPEEMLQWFCRAIVEYENYNKQWRDFQEKTGNNITIDLTNVPEENKKEFAPSTINTGIKAPKVNLVDTTVKLAIFT